MSQFDWTKSWEKDQNFISSMQFEINNDLSNYSIAMRLVKDFSRVLSCGCGSGREVRELRKKNCKVTAIDYSKKMIELSRKIEPDAEYICKDFIDYDYPSKFDFILCLFNTINYIERFDLRKLFINRCYRNLKEGGKLIIDSADRTASWKIFLRGVFFNNDYYYSPRQIDKWFEGSGFKVERIKTNGGNLIVATK